MLDYKASFYSQSHTEDTLLTGIESLLNSNPDLQVKLFPTYVEPAWWQKITQGDSPQFKPLSGNESVSLFEFVFQMREDEHKKTVRGKFFVVKNHEYPNIYTVVTLESSLFFGRGLLLYFERRYPRTSLTFITHKKLWNLLVNFRDTNGFEEFNIVRASTKTRVGKKTVSSLTWSEFSLEQAFDWVRDANGWFKNLLFKAKRQGQLPANISISRKGVVRATKYARLVYDGFIRPVSKTLNENVTLFSKRARLDNSERDIRPLSIEFSDDLFVDVEENQKLIDSLRTMRASALSVLHGNPYVHLSVFDYFDGSSFDIWVLTTNQIIIVPQLKASFQSIKRLINHIFDNYAEGAIQDYQVES